MATPTRPTLAFSVLQGVIVAVHGDAAPDDETWDRMVDASVDLYRAHQFGKMLALSRGGAPTSAQRHRFDLRVRDLVATTGPLRARVALVSDSAFDRAIISISGLMEEGWQKLAKRGDAGPQSVPRMYRAFSPAELPQALAWLGIPELQKVTVLREVERLRGVVGG